MSLKNSKNLILIKKLSLIAVIFSKCRLTIKASVSSNMGVLKANSENKKIKCIFIATTNISRST